MLKLIFLLLALLSSCLSLKDKGQLYFIKNQALGVEPVDTFLERMNLDKQLRHLMYGELKTARIVQCTLLRNQLYVASIKSSDSEVAQAVKILEPAYQNNNEEFLKACDQVSAMKVGQIFLAVQKEYVEE